MNEYLVIAIFIIWYTLAMIISETLGKRKKIGVEWSFFISFLLSPVVGFLVTYFSRDLVHAETQRRGEKAR
jgi:fumarate reductase subunit C